MIKYYEGAEPTVFDESYPVRLTTGQPRYPEEKAHDEIANSLFFFENMQGIGPDKRQDANGDGKLDFPGLPDHPDKYPNYRPKDAMPYGTYIEVDAYYVSVNPEKSGKREYQISFYAWKR